MKSLLRCALAAVFVAGGTMVLVGAVVVRAAALRLESL